MVQKSACPILVTEDITHWLRWFIPLSVLWSVSGKGWGRGRGWMSKLFSQGEENVITVTFWWILQIRDKILEDINIIGHATLYQRTCGHPHHHPFWQEISEMKRMIKSNRIKSTFRATSRSCLGLWSLIYTNMSRVEAVSSAIRECPPGRERLVSDGYYNIIVLRLMGALTGNYNSPCRSGQQNFHILQRGLLLH